MNNDGQLIVQEQTIVPDLLCFYSRDWMKKEILLRGKLFTRETKQFKFVEKEQIERMCPLPLFKIILECMII